MVQGFPIGDLLTLSLHEPMKVVSVTLHTGDSVRPASPRQRRHWPWGRILLGILGVALGALGAKAYIFLRDELPSSALQARYLSALGSQISFAVEPGPSPLIRYPRTGPYDLRLGYVGLPGFLQRLRTLGFTITAQARVSPKLAQVVDRGFFPMYHEKMQAGLRLFDQAGTVVYSTTVPAHIYHTFDDIPPVVLQTLLFIENRELFDERYPQRNPAVEWDRFGLAAVQTLLRVLPFHIAKSGGSTLATQLEKFRHSPDGRTGSVVEKFRQMGSASIRAYLDGPNTLPARREVALAYLNSVPLGAIPGYGEVHSLGDGLWAWYGAEFALMNRLLGADALAATDSVSAEQATAYRQVLCLLIAQRRPAWYLGEGYAALQALANGYLRLMTAQGVIPDALRDAALNVPISLRSSGLPADTSTFASHKTASTIRARLAQELGVASLYDLDRLDVTVTSTLDTATQQAVTEALQKLSQPEYARAAGLYGEHLFGGKEDLSRVIYSFTLYEHRPQGNLLRVNTDNYTQPLDINDGIRLDLGSTAKLRTLVHYLALIAEIYQRYAGQSPQELRALTLDRRDYLSRWVVERLQVTPQPSLTALLDAALERRYSASPGESFFTGGGVHTFANFNDEDDSKIMSVRQALRDSVNLVYIRVMRDVVYHYLYRPGAIASQLEASDSPQRRAYLERFADHEGQVFLRRFYAKYRGKSPQEALVILTHNAEEYPARLATIYRTVYPEQNLVTFTDYIRAHLETPRLSETQIAELYSTYAPERFDLHDRGYIAHLHPLELWLVNYLVHHPQAKLQQVMDASTNERQEVYRWLFKSGRKYAQNKRIQSLLELEAFSEVHQFWKRLGYPFETLTPSYASAIGAAGDRPAALATLMGILLNDGVLYPSMRFDSFHFAAGTPYETQLALPPVQGTRLLPSEVAAAARSALIDVVEQGTARRLKGVYQRPDRQPLQVGGKTGTGDHRYESYGAHGRVTGSRVVSRAATFVFFLGDRFFGVVTAYVTGPEAARYHFTSALPVQVLKSLAPSLTPRFEWTQGEDGKNRREKISDASRTTVLASPMERRKGPSLTPAPRAAGRSPAPSGRSPGKTGSTGQ
jgi:membrane peptidoglycan carboxypeptidase